MSFFVYVCICFSSFVALAKKDGDFCFYIGSHQRRLVLPIRPLRLSDSFYSPIQQPTFCFLKMFLFLWFSLQ